MSLPRKPHLRRTNRPPLPSTTPHLCISVVGLPSHRLQLTPDGRLRGVGKSCLCSRFVLPSYDDYAVLFEDHSSQLSAREFESSPYHWGHFLYFGSVVKLIAQRPAVFHVVEHTTFVDNALQPLTGGGSYAVRATRGSLHSSGKVAYLTMKYDQYKEANAEISPAEARSTSRSVKRRHAARERFPTTFDGNTSAVAGYVLVVDATRVAGEMDLQMDLMEMVVGSLRDQPNPFRMAVAVTKCDESSSKRLSFVSDELHRRLGDVAVFFVSARKGVGVDSPFFFIHSQVVQENNALNPSPSGALPFKQAQSAREHAIKRASDEARTFLKNTVLRFDMTWKEFSAMAGGSQALVALFSLRGAMFCQQLFRDRLVDILRGSLRETLAAGLSNHPDLTEEWKSLFWSPGR